MKLRFLLAAAALSAMTTGPASAQQQPQQQPQPIRLILNFDGPLLGELLTQIGATWEQRTDDQGKPYLSVKFRNGANAVASPSVCKGEQPNTGCTGLHLWANFDRPQNLTPGAVAQRVNQYNLTHIATMATYGPSGNAQINMYVISEGGIAITNLGIKLQVFEAATTSFSQDLYKP